MANTDTKTCIRDKALAILNMKFILDTLFSLFDPV